ncbi:MAG: YdiU family protein [Verrucomicrobiae bacterium]|nr:YdiU family protein [Verrucomicrobiae bacterium]
MESRTPQSEPAATATAAVAGWNLSQSYAALPPQLYSRVAPSPVRAPSLVIFNASLAKSLGLDAAVLGRPEAAPLFAGNAMPPGADPIAQAYAGHQFGHFTLLGDGRAILLGEQLTPDGRRLDIQLKGPGRTPYSRRGDGRAALGPMLREYLISEAMHALGIPTTRSLAVTATGEPVFREQTLPGAVLTRVAASHLRVGTFEWAAARGDHQALEALAVYARHRHDPEIGADPGAAAALLEAVAGRQAALVARWQLVGFVHGVMNTDNMALSGETLDYGPCAFMDAYDPGTVFSSIDHQGRYAYGNQPGIAQWNLARLAEGMLPLLHRDPEQAVAVANGVLERFPSRFEQHWLDGMRAKLGLLVAEPEDRSLVDDLLGWMQRQGADFTNTFRDLDPGASAAEPGGDEAFEAWRRRWRARLSRQPHPVESVRVCMQRHNPAVIPRNHLVEAALSAAGAGGDLGPFNRLLRVLAAPYDRDAIPPEFGAPPGPEARGFQTYCGT